MATINAINFVKTIGAAVEIISEEKAIYSNAQRVRLICVNTSTALQVITIAVGVEPVNGAGIVLYPGGSISWETQGNIPLQQKRVLAISSAAGGTLSVYEEVLQ